MPRLIRFTLIEDEQDVRPYDFDTQTVQIGADPDRGDNLLIDLPPRLKHVRAKVFRQEDYVEMEVKGGPIWVGGSKLEDGDVVELNVGDLLIFGTKKPRGVRLRFEYATEASIFIDDVADWSASAAPKKKRGKSAEDDLTFDEEKDPTEGMNPYQKGVYFYRQQYAKFAKFRKKASQLGYWTSLAAVLMSKARGILMLGAGLGALGFGWYNAHLGAEKAGDEQVIAESRTQQAILARDEALQARAELEGLQAECGCGPGDEGGSAVAATEALTTYFDDDNGNFAPERAVAMPDRQMRSMGGLVGRYMTVASRNHRLINTTIDRVCGGDKDRMEVVQRALGTYDLHEVYSFIPFVESQWCELAISFTGPRGMMQFTRATAKEAFGKIDPTQANIPNFPFKSHYDWMLSKSGKYGGYYSMLAQCPATVRADYVRTFYDGQTNPDYPRRTDPRDPRTDWEWASKAAFSWLETLDSYYKGKGYGETDSAMLAMAAYNQGRSMVQRWIDKAEEGYPDQADSLTYTHIYGGGMKLLMEEKDAEQKRRIKEGMEYPLKTFGYYLVTAPKLDAKRCRD